jgi:hypothetical protein
MENKCVERDPSLRETVETICKITSIISEKVTEIDEKLFKGNLLRDTEPGQIGSSPPSIDRYLKEAVIELDGICEDLTRISIKIAED